MKGHHAELSQETAGVPISRENRGTSSGDWRDSLSPELEAMTLFLFWQERASGHD